MNIFHHIHMHLLKCHSRILNVNYDVNEIEFILFCYFRRIGYCHGHYLSMKEDKNEPLMATLEDE